MVDSVEKAHASARYGLLDGVFEEDIAKILALGHSVVVKAGEEFIALGGQASRFYLVRRGRVRLTMPMTVRGDEREILIEEKGRGDSVGWSSLVPPYRFTLNGRASVESELVEIPGKVLREYLSTNRDVGFTVIDNLAQMIGRRLLTLQTMWARAMQRTVESLDRNA